MSHGRIYEFGFDEREQHEELHDIPDRACPDCGSPLQATRLATVCLDCERVVASERTDQ